jgi:hypothetical protein
MSAIFDGMNWESETKIALHKRVMDLERERIASEATQNTTTIIENKETMTTEHEYITNCFVDLTDSGDIEKITSIGNKVSINFKRSKTVNKTFNNYLQTTRKTAKLLEMIDESLTKVRINNPHLNVILDTYERELILTMEF